METPSTADAEGGRPDAPRGRRARRRTRVRLRFRVPPLPALLFLGAVVRLALLGWFSGLSIHTDEKDYHRLATHLVEFGEFSYDLGEPLSLRPPLYPFLLAAVYEFFGLGNFQAARALQAALSLATATLVYDLGRRVYDRRAGLWAAGLYLFYPSLLVSNNLILTEVLFTFFLTATVLCLVRGVQAGSVGWVVAAGVSLGLGALTRSVLWLFIPVVSAYVLAAWGGPPGRRLLAAGSLFLTAALVVAPWAARNTALEKTFLAVDSMGGRNVMMGNYEHTPLHRAWDAISIGGEKSWGAVLAREVPESSGATQGQRDKMAMRYGVKYALTHPARTAGRDLVKFFDFWGLEREQVAGASRGWFGPLPKAAVLALSAVLVGGYVGGFFLGIFGAFAAPPDDRRAFGLMLLVIAFVTGMHTLSFGHSRYHLPLMPLVLTFAAGALSRSRAVWASRGGWPFRLAAGVCLVFALEWAYNLAFVDNRLVSALGG